MFQNVFWHFCWTFKQFCKFVLHVCPFSLPLTTPKSFLFCVYSTLFLDILIFSLSCMSVFPLFLCNNICISCRWAADWLISWSGHPRPSHCWAPVYRGCPCREQPVWWLTQAGWWVTKTPTLFCCSALVFCCTDCTLDVFTRDITKIDQCCVLILRRRKSKQIDTCLDVTCMAGKLNWSWHAPLSHASTLSHSQSCCWGVLSIFDSFTPSCLGVSLTPCTVRFTWFLIRIISCPLTSITLLMVESSFFNLRLLFRLSLPWPDLFGSTLITGFLIFLVTLFLDVLAFNYTRVLWHAADFDFFAFGSWNFLIVNVWQFHCRVLIVTVLFCTCSCEWAFTASLNNSRWATWHHTNRDNVTTSSGLFTTSSTQNLCRSSHSDDMVIHSSANL